MGQGSSTPTVEPVATAPTVAEVVAPKEIDLRLPGYFPTYKQECTVQAKEFFECFSQNSVKKEKGDLNAGVEGLKTCHDLLEKYKQCMEK